MIRRDYLEIRNNFNFIISNPILLMEHLVSIGFFAICYLIWHFASGSFLQYFAVPLFSIFVFRSFALLHEASHGVASANKTLNDFVGLLHGSICFLPYEPWRQSHAEHHLWAGNVDKDPVMALIHLFPKFPKFLKTTFNVCWRLWLPVVALAQNVVFWVLCAGHLIKKFSSILRILSVIAPIFFWIAFVALMPTSFLAHIVAPALFLYLVIFEIVGLAHHLRLPQARGEIRLQVWDQHHGTRTCFYPKWIARYTTLNFNYHTEHHLFPTAPWYFLQDLHSQLKFKLGESYNLSVNADWHMANRSIKFEQVLLEKIPSSKQITETIKTA